MKKPTRKPKLKPKPNSPVPFDYVTRKYLQDTFHQQFQPVQQELAQLVLEVRRYSVMSQNIGKSLAKIENDLDSLVKHFLAPKPKTQRVQT